MAQADDNPDFVSQPAQKLSFSETSILTLGTTRPSV